MKVAINDIIKAYDFPGNTDYYMVGKVVTTDQDFIYCTMVKQVSGGKVVSKSADSFQTPKQGLAFGDSSFQRIQVIA
jgi:hypothetical protein